MKGLQKKDTMEKNKCNLPTKGILYTSGFKNYTMSEQQEILDTIEFRGFQRCFGLGQQVSSVGLRAVLLTR